MEKQRVVRRKCVAVYFDASPVRPVENRLDDFSYVLKQESINMMIRRLSQ